MQTSWYFVKSVYIDNNFYNQQMHTLYFVGHLFIWIETCRQTYKVPYKIKSVHLLVIKVIITQKCTEQHISKSVYIVLNFFLFW